MNRMRFFIFFLVVNTSIFAQMAHDAKIYVAGHRGLVGSALCRRLHDDGYTNLITRTRQELDLLDEKAVHDFFLQEKPDYVFLAAAKVGGIHANDIYPGQFLYENLKIELNIIHAAYQVGVTKLLFLGSSCIYPRDCAQPIQEEYLLTGPLEKTNEWYAIAKIAGLKLCQAYNKQYGTNFISCMPTNLYGPGDNFDLKTAHVLPALIAKFINAKKEGKKEVVLWGSGTPRREFLYVDDCADACIFLMNEYNGADPINVGVGHDMSIKELALLVAQYVGFEGELIFDTTMPDGTPQKLLCVDKLTALGWHAATTLDDGISKTVDWFEKMQ